MSENVLDSRLLELLSAHHLLHLATCTEGVPWCASLFYALNKEQVRLIVASNPKTRHTLSANAHSRVAGSIALESEMIGEIRGVQFEGIWQRAKREDKRCYFARFPYACALFPTLWAIALTYVKLTDNRLGFGKKLEFFFD